MIAAAFRHVITAWLGRPSCHMPVCGRAVRSAGYCSKHLVDYYAPRRVGR